MAEFDWIAELEERAAVLDDMPMTALAAGRRKRLAGLLDRARRATVPLQATFKARADAALVDYMQARADSAAASPARGTTGSVSQLTALLDAVKPDRPGGFDGILQQQELDLVVDFSLHETPASEQPPVRELRAARHLRTALVQLGAERRVQQASREAHDDSGPLNPQRLVTDALHLMEQLSPAYLERFIAYADTLLWLDQAGARLKPAAGS